MHHGKTILIVEDDESIRESLQQLLELEGYTVFTANNGKDALTHLGANGKPSLILLDLMMPVMDGWEFLKAHHADPKIADIPVVVTSAVPGAANNVKATGFIKKPIEIEPLLKTVQRYCGQGITE